MHNQPTTRTQGHIDAGANLALFPKSAGVKRSTLSTWDEINGPSVILPSVVAQGNVTSNKNNGGVNETGIRRLATIRRIAGL